MAEGKFPSLEPAFTGRLYPAEDFNIGQTLSGEMLSAFPVKGGRLVSEPGFGIQLDAEVVLGSDMARTPASQTHTQIDVNAVLKNKDGALIYYKYKGIVEADEALGAILMGLPTAQSTSYGKAFSHITFETGTGYLKELEASLFVGSARFVIENGVFSIETKISRVTG